MFLKKKIVSLKKTLKKYFIIGSQCRGFQFMLILDLWGISFHPVVVVDLGNDLLFNFIVGHCGHQSKFLKKTGNPNFGRKNKIEDIYGWWSMKIRFQ